jgi:Protein of unknown function (DUF3300)
MNIVKLCKQLLIVIFCVSLVGFNVQAESRGQQPTPVAPPSTQDLRQLVAPIALYPDALVAQVLAAATYPTEIVEADRWMQSHSGLTGEALAQEVDKQPWDPSVKALTQFPSVLENMDKNLAWTSSLGDAYANQQQDVMDAVQTMRKQARQTGNLKSNEQENVNTQGKTISIEPVNPDVVYVPAYDPWLVYGDPIAAYPFWFSEPGIFFDGPGIFFGSGFGIGFFGGFGWGWNYWGCDWHHHRLLYNHNAYVSRSRTIVNRNDFNRGRGNLFTNRATTNRSSATPHAQPGIRSGAFNGFDHGGSVRGFSSRGRSSLGGGFHGGGFHGGGGHGGGGRH